jgi:Zn-dependent protease
VSGAGEYALVILYTLPGLLVGLLVHELAHAAVALRFGDPSPRREHRMTLDPRRQLDAAGVAAFLVAGFGWARPVLLNPPLLRTRLQRAVVVAAGPLSHLVVAAVFALTLRIALLSSGIDIGGFITTAQSSAQGILTGILLQGFFVNVAFSIFTALPLPGLDGYAFIRSLLFPRAAGAFLRLEAWRLAVYAVAIAAVVVPAQLTHGTVDPLRLATSDVAAFLFSHAVVPGVTPIFLGLPNIFMVLG